MAMMRAVGMDNYGGADVLHYQEMPRPEVGPGELLIRVSASGINRPDVLQRLVVEEIKLEMTGSLKPLIIKGIGDEGYKYLLMPVQAK